MFNMHRNRVITVLGLLAAWLMYCELCAAAEESAAPREMTLADVAAGRAKIVDLSYTLNAEAHYWPGAGYTPFQIETIATLQKDGVLSKKVSFPEHIGTHLDAPSHFEAGEPDVSQIPAVQFFAPGVVVDISLRAELNPDTTLTVADLKAWEMEHGEIPQRALVLVRTGWGQYWTSKERFQNRDTRGQLHFPGYSPEAAQWLIEKRDAKGIGIDTMSIDPGTSQKFDVHHLVNKAQRYGLENVAALDQLPATGFWLMVAPLKTEGGTGGPCRVFAILENPK